MTRVGCRQKVRCRWEEGRTHFETGNLRSVGSEDIEKDWFLFILSQKVKNDYR